MSIEIRPPEESLEVRQQINRAMKDFPISELAWTTQADLVAAASSNVAVLSHVKYSYHDINVEKTFSELITVSDLLHVAIAASGNHKCAAPIASIMSNYQDVVVQSLQTSGSFVEACVAALKVHKLVKHYMEKGKCEIALKNYGKCADLATKMAEQSAALADKVGTLKDEAAKALVLAKDDQIENEKERQKIEKMMNQLQSEEEYIHSQLSSLADDISEAKEEELKYAKLAQGERDHAHTMAIVGAVIGAVGTVVSAVASAGASAGAQAIKGMAGAKDGGEGGEGGAAAAPAAAAPAPPDPQASLKDLKREAEAHLRQLQSALNLFKDSDEAKTDEGKEKLKTMQGEAEAADEAAKEASAKCQQAAAQAGASAASLDDKEAAATSRKRELQNVQRDQTARLKQAVKEMEGMSVHKSEVQQAALCLGVTFQTMGRIKTAFVSVELFWRTVAKQCESLGAKKQEIAELWQNADEDMKEDDPFEVIQEAFQQSAVQWAALGFVNFRAHEKMVEAMDAINMKMTTLPGADVPPSVIDSMVRNLSVELEEADAPIVEVLDK